MARKCRNLDIGTTKTRQQGEISLDKNSANGIRNRISALKQNKIAFYGVIGIVAIILSISSFITYESATAPVTSTTTITAGAQTITNLQTITITSGTETDTLYLYTTTVSGTTTTITSTATVYQAVATTTTTVNCPTVPLC